MLKEGIMWDIMLMWRGGQVARWESSRVADDTQSLFLLERNPLCYSTLYYIHNHGWGGGDIESLSSQEKYIVPLLEIDRLHSVSQNMCTVHRTMQCINVSHFPHMSEIIKCKLKQMQTLENNMHFYFFSIVDPSAVHFGKPWKTLTKFFGR